MRRDQSSRFLKFIALVYFAPLGIVGLFMLATFLFGAIAILTSLLAGLLQH